MSHFQRLRNQIQNLQFPPELWREWYYILKLVISSWAALDYGRKFATFQLNIRNLSVLDFQLTLIDILRF